VPSSDDLSKLSSVLDALLDASPEQRGALIAKLSEGDPERRAELEALLAECEREPPLLSRPAAERFAALLADEPAGFPAALAERYRFSKELARGGMATVYLAQDLKHDREVAIKVLTPPPELGVLVSPERFRREIEIASGFNHPHIVPLYDSGEAPPDGRLFYVMPYVRGESLRDRLRRERQLPVEDAVAIAREVAEALGYALGRGVVHRDIKPENILLSEGHALVADFGIARGTHPGGEKLTQPGVILGTPAYMSPEQATGAADLDGRTDVYALGCVLYEMLAGAPPYGGGTAQAIVGGHLRDPVPQVRRLRPQVPQHVEAAIVRALEKSPADRFATPQQFAAALLAPGAGPKPRAAIMWRVAWGVAGVMAVLLGLTAGGGRDAVLRWVRGAAVPGAAEQRSVAVLPFENVGGKPEDEYFSAGLTEELIAALSQIRSLRVAARTSAFAFKGQSRDIREIGRTLSVATVLVGSVRKSGNRIRVTAQLIDVSNGLSLWSQTYDERAISDILDIQVDLGLRIARALETNLTPSEQARLARKPTENLEAYTLYLKGRFAWGQRNQGLYTAIEYFNQAIAVDSLYARAYAGLASAYGPLGLFGYIRPEEGRARMGAAARRAVELDDGLAEAHTVLGAYLHIYEWDWAAAEREFQRALELDPDFPTTHRFYGFFLGMMGRLDESLIEQRRAQDLDPLAPDVEIGTSLLRLGRYDLAEAAFREKLARDPTYWIGYDGLGQVLELTGRPREAVSAFERAVALSGPALRPKALLARALMLAGREAEGRRMIQELRVEGTRRGIYHPAVALAIAAGDTSGAFAWLEAAYRQRHPDLVRLKADRLFLPLRGDPRFQDLLRRVGFDRR
jgi:serine/threonine-protein kinase